MQSHLLIPAAGEARAWLFESVLPFWGTHGIYLNGGFVEQIDRFGPIDLPLRLRVQARQIYVFAEAGRLGWTGPWLDLLDRGLAFMLAHYFRPDGLVRCKVKRNGDCIDDSADNYDQAFALFALANAFRVTGDHGLEHRARILLDKWVQQRKHPGGGFYETSEPEAPLCANPHMHLFEAAQAWAAVSDSPRWRELADEIASLAATRLMDSESGALHEFFELDWSVAVSETGRIVEPGHEFEWAWLLHRWRENGGEVDSAVARRLYDHAQRYGTDPARKVAINAIDAQGTILDASARLWPQTERLKAALVMEDESGALEAWEGLLSYRYPDNTALFVDRRAPDGTMIDSPAYASSLYHIICAISELDRVGARVDA